MKIKEAIEKVNKQAGKEVVISKNPTMGDSKLTIETTSGEIELVQVDGDGVVSTVSRTYFVTRKYGLDEIFNTIHGMGGEYKNAVGKEYSNNFGSMVNRGSSSFKRFAFTYLSPVTHLFTVARARGVPFSSIEIKTR